MKNKKLPARIVLIVCLMTITLLLLTGCVSKTPQDSTGKQTENTGRVETIHQNENTTPAGNTEPNVNTDPVVNTEANENTDPVLNTVPNENPDSTGETDPNGLGGASIIEDGGDVDIIIPDDQGSDGL